MNAFPARNHAATIAGDKTALPRIAAAFICVSD